MLEDTLKKISALLLPRIRNRRWRGYLARFGDRLIRIVGVVTLASAVISLGLAGSEFVTRTIPNIFAAASRTVLLAGTLRPLLLDRIIRDDLGYRGQCVAGDQVVDLDRDGWASDLIVTIHPKETIDNRLACPKQFHGGSAVHLILKEVQWSGWRPKYALLHAFSVGIPTHFYTTGPFVIGVTAARVNPGYHIYAYHNGALLAFGSYRSSADEAPQLQVGGRLFMKTYDEFMSFEITPAGEARSQRMTAHDIVARNNTAVIIEDESRLSDEAKAAIEKIRAGQSQGWLPVGNYDRPAGADPKCDFTVFQNAYPIDFKPASDGSSTCTAELNVDLTTQIAVNMPCSFRGFTQSPQFPWGWIFDEREKDHFVSCPEREDDDESYSYVIRVTLHSN